MAGGLLILALVAALPRPSPTPRCPIISYTLSRFRTGISDDLARSAVFTAFVAITVRAAWGG
jgi:hypothetical protein